MHSTGHFLDKKYSTQNAVLTMQELDETGVRNSGLQIPDMISSTGKGSND